MNYVLTGGAGHITKPLALQLLKAGHQVTIIGRAEANLQELSAAGAKTAIGSVEDSAFLSKSFTGADAVYLMIPPIWNPANWKEAIGQVGKNYATALQAAGVKYAVLLSSIGAHMPDGCGPVSGLYLAEQALEAVPGLNLLALRPGYFYYNLLGNISMIKNAGIIGSNFGGNEEKLILSSTDDIASTAASALQQLDFSGFTVRYLVSDELTSQEIAQKIGNTIGKPELPWVAFTDEQAEQGLLGAGLPAENARNYVEMGTAIRSGKMFEDYQTDTVKIKGNNSFDDFLPKFKAAFEAAQ
ncbi:NmrA family NAD(P)-binding protein [Flavihumibacter cheonanensis]|uniref:NAD(P)H-binding protein n=1 Tax=Flavihumibacter cheonanensis TaxID=1442385 RepID=UPI001EF76703|nr:NAD(P)H-binding protein [Flavihumibacter cheonanensis]MCG7753657.1 NAD(P)H-binding protein [Flavihumibacter cheonanensis]